MKSITFKIIALIIPLILFSCGNNREKADAYGNFEATEITISSEGSGKLMQFDLEEGKVIDRSHFIGYIDTIPLSLKREQLLVSKEIITQRSKGILSQIDVLNVQLKTAEIEKARAERLVRDNAGTQKQLDDLLGAIRVIREQIKSVESQNAPVIAEYKNTDVQIKQIEDQLKKYKIINPVKGTVLVKYAESDEITSFGKPLYKIADLTKMQLRVYVSETQLSEIKIGQEILVSVDHKNEMRDYPGTIVWIASESEFTPKIIQTREERVALVYAVKIDVNNDGSLKIGMPAEAYFD
jgi:HlyD family secretion protein